LVALRGARLGAEEREHIIDAGEAFCRKYPGDNVCHPKE
jgi:hypothetical protein